MIASPTSSASINAGMNQQVPVVYGIDRRDALVSSITDIGDKTLIVCVWSIGEIDAVTGLTINDELPPDGTVIRHYTGTPSQGVDPALASVGSSDNMRATVGGHNIALAYSVVELPDSIGAPRIAATIRGRKVHDPRTGIVAWSDNPALVLADYMSNPVYGAGRQVTGIEAVADACDELVHGERRRRVGVTVNTDDAPRLQWVDTLKVYAGGEVVAEGLARRLIPLRPASPVMTITDEDVAPDSLTLQRPDLADTPTVIRVEYTDTSSIPWRVAPGAVAKLPGVDDGSLAWVEETLSLPGIHHGRQAAREAAERRNTIQLAHITASWSMFDDALPLQPGDVVDLALSEHSGQYRISSVGSAEPGRYQVTGTRYTPAVYDDDATAVDLLSIPPVPRQDSVDAPNIGGVTSGNGVYIEGGDGTIHNRIRVDLVVPSDPRNFSRYEIRFREANSDQPWTAGQVTGYTAWLYPVEDAATYEFEVRTIGRMGAISEWVAGTETVQAKDTPPPAPTGCDGSVNGAGIRRVSWQYGARPRDFAGFEVQYDAGSGWVDLITGHPGQRGLTQRQIVETGDMPAGNVTIRVRALDRTGNASTWSTTTENFEVGPDGQWIDVNAQIEAERLRNDNQDNSTIPAAQSQADNAWGKGLYLQDTVIPPIDSTATSAWDTGDWLKNTKVPQVESLAQSAWNLADGKIVTFYQSSTPSGADTGDLWIDASNGNQLKRWDGTSWVDARDSEIAQAIVAAQSAQATADGKVETFYQSGQPTASGVGDIWVNSADNNRIYRWSGTTWIDIHDPQILASLQLAQNAYNLADGKIASFYQNDPPTGADTGDLWIDTNDKQRLYRWDGGQWVDARDEDIPNALTAAQTAQAAADGKVVTFYQSSAPAADGVGDLWINTGDNNKLYRWSGSQWLNARDDGIGQALNDASSAQVTANDAKSTGDWLKYTEVPNVKTTAEDGQSKAYAEGDRNNLQDSQLNNHDGEISTLGLNVSNAQSTADSAQNAADVAMSTAQAADWEARNGSISAGRITTGKISFAGGGFIDLDVASGKLISSANNTFSVESTGYVYAYAGLTTGFASMGTASGNEVWANQKLWLRYPTATFQCDGKVRFTNPSGIKILNHWAGNDVTLEQWISNLIWSWINAGFLDDVIWYAYNRQNNS